MLAWRLARHFGEGQSVAQARNFNQLRLTRHTKVVLVDGMENLADIEQFVPSIASQPIRISRQKGREVDIFAVSPFFIFTSQHIISLPDKPIWNKYLAHLHLSGYLEGILFFDAINGNLPHKLVKIISEEIRQRQQRASNDSRFGTGDQHWRRQPPVRIQGFRNP